MRARIRTVVILAVLCGLGGAAIIPYLLAILPPERDLPISVGLLMLLSGVQWALLSVPLVLLGQSFARPAGLEVWGWPRRDHGSVEGYAGGLIWVFGAALASGVLLALFDTFILLPLLPEPIRPIGDPSTWARLGATIYGAVNEEVMLRLFVMSLLLWVIQRATAWARGSTPSPPVLSAAAFSALIFALGHLPVASELWPLTPFVVVRIIALNFVVGLPLGLLYAQKGLEVAMLAHGALDLGLHVSMSLGTGGQNAP